MRFTVFLSLFMATFVACTSSFASTENYAGGFAIFDEAEDNAVRRLRAEAKINKENVGKLASGLIEKAKVKSVLEKAVQMAMKADGDEAAARKAIMLAAGAKEGAKLSDDSMAKLSAMIAESAKKNPKSWSRLRKFAKITLGAGVGALAMYGAYKLMFDKSSTTAAATTTTGSA